MIFCQISLLHTQAVTLIFSDWENKYCTHEPCESFFTFFVGRTASSNFYFPYTSSKHNDFKYVFWTNVKETAKFYFLYFSSEIKKLIYPRDGPPAYQVLPKSHLSTIEVPTSTYLVATYLEKVCPISLPCHRSFHHRRRSFYFRLCRHHLLMIRLWEILSYPPLGQMSRSTVKRT